MNNQKANHYVIDLFETFSIEKNKLLEKNGEMHLLTMMKR